MPVPATLEVILLAAGRSARMRGANKLLLPVNGEPLLRRSARLWLEAGHAVLVVTPVDDSAIRTALAGLPVGFIANPDAADGQHTSVAAGLTAASLNTAAVAIALADQPLLTPADLAALLATFAQHGGQCIVVPRHGKARGNPVLLPSTIARTLRDHPAQGPPRRFIDANPALVRWHEAANDHFTTDLDTPEDIARVFAKAGFDLGARIA